jgi:hypothetical protein
MNIAALFCSILIAKKRFYIRLAPASRRRASGEAVKCRQSPTSFQGKDASWHFTRTFLLYWSGASELVYCATLPVFHSTPKCDVKFILWGCFNVQYLLLRIVQSLYWLMGDCLRLPAGTKRPEQPRNQPNPSHHGIEKLLVVTQEIPGLVWRLKILY